MGRQHSRHHHLRPRRHGVRPQPIVDRFPRVPFHALAGTVANIKLRGIRNRCRPRPSLGLPSLNPYIVLAIGAGGVHTTCSVGNLRRDQTRATSKYAAGDPRGEALRRDTRSALSTVHMDRSAGVRTSRIYGCTHPLSEDLFARLSAQTARDRRLAPGYRVSHSRSDHEDCIAPGLFIWAIPVTGLKR